MSEVKGRSLYQDAWRRVRRDPVAMSCLVLIVAYTAIALTAELGWLFPDHATPIGEAFEMKELPPGSVVWARLLEPGEAEALPPEIKVHERADGATYRLFAGTDAASWHFVASQPAAIPEDLAALATEGWNEAWESQTEDLRRFITGRDPAARDALLGAGEIVWRHLDSGGIDPGEAPARAGLDPEAYYATEDYGLDAEDLDELTPASVAAWDDIPAAIRGWIQQQPTAERDRLVRGGTPVWRALAAAGLSRGAPLAPGSGEPPADAAATARAAFSAALADRAPQLARWLAWMPADARARRLAGGVTALAELGRDDVRLETSTLEAAGYWHVHTFWLGSDRTGRDVMRRVAHGTKISMKVGLLASLIAIPIGVFLGALAGYFGGFIDDLIVWIYTTLACVPGLLLILAIAWAIGGGLKAVYIALGATTWVQLCRLIRGEMLKLREQDFVLAARALGVPSARIIRRHILPNAMHLVIITFSLRFVTAILAEVVLSYLGIGVDVSQPSWGRLISETQSDLASRGVWWVFAATSVAMFGIVLSFNVFGDAVRDALDPKLKR